MIEFFNTTPERTTLIWVAATSSSFAKNAYQISRDSNWEDLGISVPGLVRFSWGPTVRNVVDDGWLAPVHNGAWSDFMNGLPLAETIMYTRMRARFDELLAKRSGTIRWKEYAL